MRGLCPDLRGESLMDREKLELARSELPVYYYAFIDPKELEFSQRIRWICQHECPM